MMQAERSRLRMYGPPRGWAHPEAEVQKLRREYERNTKWLLCRYECAGIKDGLDRTYLPVLELIP